MYANNLKIKMNVKDMNENVAKCNIQTNAKLVISAYIYTETGNFR